MHRLKTNLIAVLIFFGTALTCLAIPEKPSRLVNDYAACLGSPFRTDSLERALVAFDDSTSNQICVLTVPTLDGMAASDYAVQTFNSWKIGSEKNNNGVLILIKPKTDREYGEIWITTGYGLEGALTDAVCHNIINKIMIPKVKKEDYIGAVSEACAAIMSIAIGEYNEELMDEDRVPGWIMLVIVIGIVILLYIVSKEDGNNGGGNGTRRRPNIIITPGSGRSSFGGTSFGGGFGGFGGGLSGGGGAGGRW